MERDKLAIPPPWAPGVGRSTGSARNASPFLPLHPAAPHFCWHRPVMRGVSGKLLGILPFGFLQCFENRFLRVLERGKDVLGNLLNKLGSPERVSHVVVDDANVMKVKRHIRLV